MGLVGRHDIYTQNKQKTILEVAMISVLDLARKHNDHVLHQALLRAEVTPGYIAPCNQPPKPLDFWEQMEKDINYEHFSFMASNW